jgi:trk system potassium uptake protein TrkH
MAALRAHLVQITSPNTVAVVKYEGRRVENDVLSGLILFFTGYILLLGTMTVAVSLTGVDTVSALFAVWTTLGNVGYGFGPLVMRTGTFIDFPQDAIVIMTVAMLLGRLGLLAILVIVLPNFWRK